MEKRKEKFLKNKSGNEKLCFYQAVYKQVGRMGEGDFVPTFVENKEGISNKFDF